MIARFRLSAFEDFGTSTLNREVRKVRSLRLVWYDSLRVLRDTLRFLRG
ncbi:MAG: hypothetical protein LAT67_08165 [Balneolales bacterium]|nr:hypothetical protein [Balneolales bacterium]